MQSWFESWTTADILAFVSAVAGVASLLLGAVNASATVSPVTSVRSRRGMQFSIVTIVLGAILLIAGVVYLSYSRKNSSASKAGTSNTNLNANGQASAPSPTPQQASVPERRNTEAVKISSFNISRNDSSWDYNYCVRGDFSVDVLQRPDSIDFNVNKALIKACTRSRHDFTQLAKVRIGIWNYEEKPKKGNGQTVWAETSVNKRIPLGENYSLEPFTMSIQGKLPKRTTKQTLIIQLVFKGENDENKVSYFDKSQLFPN